MAKKKQKLDEDVPKERPKNPISTSKMLPSEWARSKGKNEKFYFYHDKQGVVTEEEFDSIEV